MMKSMPSNLLMDGTRMNKVFIEGFRKNDIALKHQGFGYEFSGTTIVTAMVQGNRIVTANAGDSRAVLGSLRSKNYQLVDQKIEARAQSVEANEMAWFSKMLTRDHKPDDPDE
jgi:serine/threonine protein phosphatase PrpC